MTAVGKLAPARALRPTALASLQAPARVGDDLEFLFEGAASSMGCASNWAPLVDLALTGVRGTRRAADPMSEARVEAACRARRIETRFRRILTADTRNLLAAAYEPRRWPEGAETLFGPWTGAAVLTLAFRRAAGSAGLAYLETLIATNDRALHRAIAYEASKALLTAWEAYEATEGGP